MKDLKTIILLILGTIVFGILNVAFHFWTDWNFGIYMGQLQGVDLTYGPSIYPDLVILNSLYSGPRLGALTFIQILLVMSLAGYFTTKTIIDLFKKRKISKPALIIALIFWIVKIPVTVEYSNLKGIYAGLLAW